MEINLLKTKATAIDYATGEVPEDMEVTLTAGARALSNVRVQPREVCSITLDGERLDFIQPSEPMTYLGYDLTLTGSWKAEIKKIKEKTVRLASVLDKHKFTESQGQYLFQCCAMSTFRYSVGVAQWTPSDMIDLAFLWVRAYKNAAHLSRSVARSLVLFPHARGGLQLPNPFSVAFKEVGAHIQRCLNYDDNIAAQLWDEARAALDDTLCADISDLQAEVGYLSVKSHSNTFVRWAYLAETCRARIEWSCLPVRATGMGWAEVLRPIRHTDVQWSADEFILRRAATIVRDNGYDDVLLLPSFNGRISVPYCRGLTEPTRARLQQWLQRTVSKRMVSGGEIIPSRSASRTRLETIGIVGEILAGMTRCDDSALGEFLDCLSISLSNTQHHLDGIVDILTTRRVRSWSQLKDTICNFLFPADAPSSSSRTLSLESADHKEQVRRFSLLLHHRITGVRIHHTGKGWEFKCQLSGRCETEVAALLSLPDRHLARELVSSRRAMLLPPEWWTEDAPTAWGWWVLPVEVAEEGVLVRCMERQAVHDPPIFLPMRGEGSAMQALQHMCAAGTTLPTRWVNLKDMGYEFQRNRRSGASRRWQGERAEPALPQQVHNYLRLRPPLETSELLPTRGWVQMGAKGSVRNLVGAKHVQDRKFRPAQMKTYPIDDLSDTAIIADTSLLLQYHLTRFRSAVIGAPSRQRAAPKTISAVPGKVGIHVQTHSFMDAAPPRLNGDLVKVVSHSARYTECISDIVGVSYQGSTRITDASDSEGWDLDGMRWHQILSDGLVTTPAELHRHRQTMQAAEKRGYRTLSWTVMHQVVNKMKLDRSYGEPLFGSFPSLQTVTALDQGPDSAGRGWLLLDAVPAGTAQAWIERMRKEGGGIVASTCVLNVRKEVRHMLRTQATSHFAAMVSSGLKRVKGWWHNSDTKTAKGKQTLHLWLLLPERDISTFSSMKRWLETAATSTLYPISTSGRARSYWLGSEAGRLGLYQGDKTLLASDGSAGDTALGAGYTLRMGGM
eukprot:3940685-Rhodomonas_salina.1